MRVNGHSSDEPSYSNINDAYENQRDVEHKFEEVLIKSHIGNSVAPVENNFKVSSGMFNKGLEDDDKNPYDSDVDQCSLIVNAPASPSPSFSSKADAKIKPMAIENPNADQPTINDELGSPSYSLSTSDENEVKLPGTEYKSSKDEEENDSNKPRIELNDEDDATKETPPSTPSSFDFGPPLNFWSTDSQRSSPSLSNKDLEEGSDSDDTLAMESSESSDDASVASYSMNAGVQYQHQESGINSDGSEPTTDAHVKDSESNENNEQIFESNSDVSSSKSMEEFMEYDLLDIEESEKEDESNVVFKGLQKRGSYLV